MKLTVRELTRILNGQLILGDPRSTATGASVDSRTAAEGDCFFALKGEKQDGHKFAAAAMRRNVAAVIVSQLDWLKAVSSPTSAVIRVADCFQALRATGQAARTSFKGPVVGITGSNGKTTTKQMTASVLKALGPGLSTVGNFNSQIGLPIILSGVQANQKWMVLEMGASAPGNIAGLAEIARPTVGIITSIGPAHLATFGSLQRIAESKWELMDSLPSDGCAIAPWNEPMLEPLVRSYRKKIIFFGEDPSCPVRATKIEVGEAVRFLLHIGSQNVQVKLPLPGRVNVFNALAAAAAGWSLGCTIEKIAQGLESFEPPAMRMQVLRHASGCIVLNDAYNSNPASMLQAAQTLAETYPGRRRVMVMGSMLELGDESEKLHFHLGVELARFQLEKVFLVGSETKFVREGAISAGAAPDRFELLESAHDVAGRLLPWVQPNAVILFKGSRGIHLEVAIDSFLKPAAQNAVPKGTT